MDVSNLIFADVLAKLEFSDVRDDVKAIAKEKVYLDNNLYNKLGEERYKRFVRKMVPHKLEFEKLITIEERAELRKILNGQASPAWVHGGTGQVLASGRIYYDNYKNGTHSMTVLLASGVVSAATVAEVLEEEMPVKVFFIPYAQWTSSRPYSYYKMKIVFKKR